MEVENRSNASKPLVTIQDQQNSTTQNKEVGKQNFNRPETQILISPSALSEISLKSNKMTKFYPEID